MDYEVIELSSFLHSCEKHIYTVSYCLLLDWAIIIETAPTPHHHDDAYHDTRFEFTK